MMYISWRRKEEILEHESWWHVGEPINQDHVLRRFDSYDFCMVQADGDELQYILSNFGGLPYLKVRNDGKIPMVWRWYGDHAKFIVGNL